MFNWIWGMENPPQEENFIQFTLLGNEHRVSSTEVDPSTTLNDYLRNKLLLFGTKRMCFEGGCGACVVAIQTPGDDEFLAVNSCLVSILSCHKWKIETVEGIGGPTSKYHPIQKALAEFNGTQCGFCSPGMVMNMYPLCMKGKPTMREVENAFGGNICRCTGYRPILTAFKSICKDASTELLGTYPDIEDFCIIQMPKKLPEVSFTPKELNWQYNSVKWLKVFTVKEILNILAKLTDEIYMLVAGNTGKGVYKLPDATVYIDITDVPELKSFQLKNNVLTIGANMSLTKAINLFQEIGDLNRNFSYLKIMADHINLVAHVAVRNIGTIAGNLMLKYMRNDFPSDIFLLLETFAAKVVIIDTKGREVTVSLTDFLSSDMRKRVIKSVILKSFSSEYKYQTFKIMPRAQNAHALVNAGMIFGLDSSNIVQTSRIVFGNISSRFNHATKTERFLIGKQLFDNKTLLGAFECLDQEVEPEINPPEPSPEFRKQLAIALLYKGILSIAPEGKLSSRTKSGSQKLMRPISSGMQEYETSKSWYPLTKPIPKIEALAQTSGQAQYIDDIPDLPHQLYGQFVLAKAPPTSRILKIDASKALELEGVSRFFTKDDIIGQNNFFPREFGAGIVEPIFADGTIDYFHQPVGLIVASDKFILQRAVDLVEILYSPPKREPILSVEDILRAKAEDKLVKGRVIKAKKIGTDTKHVIRGNFKLTGQYHFHMELQCCLAVPTEDGLDLFTSTQWMDFVQISVANMLNISQNRIYVKVRRCGGGFGAKISRNTQIACAAGLAAWILKQPVRISLNLKDNMEFIGKRTPFYAEYEVKVNGGGVIQHLTTTLYMDQGIGGNEVLLSTFLFDLVLANYNSDPFDVVYYRAITDTPAHTWARSPGSMEGLGLMESIMDHIAYELNMDSLDVRIVNITTATQLFPYIDDLKNWADIDNRKYEISKFNKENRWKKRGISVALMAWKFTPNGPLVATVSIYHHDGSVCISHGGIEIGQGINTKAAQICAFNFNISMEKVRVLPSNTMVSANSFVTGGSFTSEGICFAVQQACEDLLSRLEPYRKKDQSQTWEELIIEAYRNFVNLTAIGQYDPKVPSVKEYLIYGSCAAEVEVDILTGQHQLTRVDLIEDVGVSLSPLIDIGQVEGAFIMGLGNYTSEQLEYNKDGRLLTNNTWRYKPPGAKDIPVNFQLKFPKNNPNPVGVMQSKAVGEPPLCLSVSVPLAIRNAVSSARTDSDAANSKYFEFDGPTTVENTFLNCLNDYKQYTL